jgi:YVTN family beta-propeller protein
MSCKDRISTYLKGIIGVRPMIDLNSHFLLVMNRDASISVIDPAVGITGVTNLFAQVVLERPAADWAKTRDQKRLFVTMPLANAVAVVDAEVFKTVGRIDAGEDPIRAVLQADERYLWVGNDAKKPEQSGVTVIDTVTQKAATFIQTGKGHHEIALSEGDRYAFVTNREEGTVTVIDVQTLKKVKDIATGPLPISIAFSPLGKSMYVADASDGTVSVIDTTRLEVTARVEVRPGLGPIRFSPNGRWAVVVNPVDNTVHAIDASTNRLAHTIPVGTQPYQVNFSRAYAYVRSLGTEFVAMVPLAALEGSGVPPVTTFAAGSGAPGKARDISIAESVIPAVKEAAVFVVNQAEGTVYFYMEGMNSPAGAFRNYGHDARAIEIVDRSLREEEPGVYVGRVKVPVAGTYDVAFLMDAPRFVHCFNATVEPNPLVKKDHLPFIVEFLLGDRRAPVGKAFPLRFKVTDPNTGVARKDLNDLEVLYYTSSGRDRTVVPARQVEDGVFEAEVLVREATAYYAFVNSRSSRIPAGRVPFATLMGVEAAPPAPAAGEQKSN